MTKAKTKTMTISEMASVLDVSGASITALVNKWQLKPTKTGEYNRKYYGAKDCQRIIDYYQSKAKTGTKTSRQTTKDDLIQALREQVKDQRHQIDQLNEQLKMAQINLSQSQQLQLQQVKQIKRLEAPQEATGAVVSTSNRQDTEEEYTGRENVSQDE